MKHVLAAAAAAFCMISAPAMAALPVGSDAPQFTASGYQAGNPISFDLNEALKKGPVVLYFFPSPHTSGCNLEAHLFAEAMDQFKALGATVIGVTAQNLNQLAVFSSETQFCSGKFPVAADPNGKIGQLYSSKVPLPFPVDDRVSYVITPKGKIILAYAQMAAAHHVDQALAALKAWREKHPA